MNEMLKRLTDIVEAELYEESPKHIWAERIVRAVAAGLREPTEAMWAACEKDRAEFETGIGWRVMIDEVLK